MFSEASPPPPPKKREKGERVAVRGATGRSTVSPEAHSACSGEDNLALRKRGEKFQGGSP